MRRSRDGGGIRLSCSHVSQSDTRSVGWQEVVAHLFLDNVFQVVSGSQPPNLARQPRSRSRYRPSVGRYPERPAHRARKTRSRSHYRASIHQNREPPPNPAHQTRSPLPLQSEHPPEHRATPRPRSQNPATLAPQTAQAPEPRAAVPTRSPNPQTRVPQTTHPPEPRANTDTPTPPGKGFFTPHIFPRDRSRSSVRHTRWFYTRRTTAPSASGAPRP